MPLSYNQDDAKKIMRHVSSMFRYVSEKARGLVLMESSQKSIKKCPFCSKEVVNLGLHVANIHPQAFAKIDETDALASPPPTPSLLQNTPLPVQSKPFQSINELIREKLDTMLNIKIIEMLSNNKDVSLTDLKKSLEPQQNSTLSDIKAYHDMLYGKDEPKAEINMGGDGGGWLELANNALPLINRMLPGKQQEIKANDTEHRQPQEGSVGIRRLIPSEIAGDTREPKSFSGQSSPTIRAEQQDNNVDASPDKGNRG